MQRCGDWYGVFIDGKWQWGLSYQEAAQIESEVLWTEVQVKMAKGAAVILNKNMATKLEQVGKK